MTEVVEGCYIPFEWAKDFEKEYLDEIKFYCLIMSEKYIENHFDDIREFASIIEDRGDDEGWSIETARRDNAQMLEQCQKHGVEYILVDEEYRHSLHLTNNDSISVYNHFITYGNK